MNVAAISLVNASSPSALSMIQRGKHPSGTEVKPHDKPAVMEPQARPELPAARVSQPAPSEPCQGAATPVQSQPLTLAELQGAFGTSNRRCDLDGNGIVDMDDLVAFITSLPVPASPLATESIGDEFATPPIDKPAYVEPTKTPAESDIDDAPMDSSSASASTGGSSLTIEGFNKAWGQNGTDYDLNGDGTVNMDDLVQFITGLSPAAPSNVPSTRPPVERPAMLAANPAVRPDSGTKTSDVGTNPKKSDQLITSMIDRLSELGFAKQPPINIRQLIQSLDLSPSQSNAAIRTLQQHYPKGLGVNLVA